MAEIKFYTDEHIHREAVEQLQNKGVEIIHCADVNMLRVEDIEHLSYATANGYIMVTCDTDFEGLDAEWQAQGKEHCGIV